MQRFTPSILLLYTCMVILSLAQQVKAQKNPSRPSVSIIFDTDMGPDYDDVGAIAVLHALADSGKCTILATMASNKHPLVAAVLNVLNTYFNRPGIPIGVVSGESINMMAPQKWDSLLVAKYPHQIRSNDQAIDALELYRKILADQPDHSVTIVTVGFFTNMANLLASPPDKFSNLNGKALVEKKVIRLVSMAGRFDQEKDRFREFNVVKDPGSSKYTFDNWPTPILFSGFEIGAKLFTGLEISRSDVKNSPVKDVFAHCIPLDPNDSKGRMSWDETAVLIAINGTEPYFNMVTGGIIGKEDGSTGWDTNGTRDAYIEDKMPEKELENLLNKLIAHQPMPPKK